MQIFRKFAHSGAVAAAVLIPVDSVKAGPNFHFQ
jgi:hypothetical protein